MNIILKRPEIAGFLFLIAGIVIFMGIITAEIYYPSGYTTRENEISDLAATKPPDSIITQPSATIFNSIMIFSGIIIILASFILFRYNKDYLLNMPLFGLGVGALGVGLFPGNITPIHSIFAFIIFISGGISALVSVKITRFPLNLVFAGLGMISLFFLLFNQILISYLGKGGTERWVAYPIIIWIIGFGSYLAGSKDQSEINS